MQQIGQYTDNGIVVRVIEPGQAMGLSKEIEDLLSLYMPSPVKRYTKRKKGGGKKC